MFFAIIALLHLIGPSCRNVAAKESRAESKSYTGAGAQEEDD